jgi:hypothetical protein
MRTYLRRSFEPAFYALTLDTYTKQHLYVGVHYTLDEAFGAARTSIMRNHPKTEVGEISLNLWSSELVRNISDLVVAPGVKTSEPKKEVTPLQNLEDKKQKLTKQNELLSKLLESSDGEMVKRALVAGEITEKESLFLINKITNSKQHEKGNK